MVSRTARKSSPPKPYKQGRLDSLCGLYATINAMRFACQTAGIEDKVKWETVFRVMLEQVDARWRMVDILTEGTDKPEIQQCFRAAAVYLKRQHAIRLRVAWPWSNKTKINPAKALVQLGKKLDHGRALFFGYEGHKESHWVAVTNVTRTHLILMNSSVGRTMKISDFVFHPEGHLSKSQTYVLCPWSIALISVAK